MLPTLDGSKTETRRPVRTSKCPYGAVGDRLWVKEACSIRKLQKMLKVRENTYEVEYQACGGRQQWVQHDPLPKWLKNRNQPRCPAIYMPRVLCRVELELTNVRRQPIQDITEEEAIREATGFWYARLSHRKRDDASEIVICREKRGLSPIQALYSVRWDMMHGKKDEGWLMNIRVWALTYKLAKVVPMNN